VTTDPYLQVGSKAMFVRLVRAINNKVTSNIVTDGQKRSAIKLRDENR
jgi:hypothetical protein